MCRVCGEILLSQECQDRGVGLTCVKHTPRTDVSRLENPLVQYWITEAYEDISTAYFLKRKGNKKLESAFFAHLSVEKTLKALVAQYTQYRPPKIHNLVELTRRANLEINMDQKNFLLMLAAYEIDGRYPEERQTLLSRTPVHRFDEILEKASEMIQWCTQQIN